MATIQVRDLPEETYEQFRAQARAAGQSLQAYMRDQLVALAGSRARKAAVLASWERELAEQQPRVSREDILRDLDDDRGR